MKTRYLRRLVGWNWARLRDAIEPHELGGSWSTPPKNRQRWQSADRARYDREHA